MEQPQPSGRRQFSVVLDEADYIEVERIARQKRSSIAQVIREYVVVGIEREQRIRAAEAVV